MINVDLYHHQTKILLNAKIRIKLPVLKKPCPATLISAERHNHPQASRSLHHRRSETLAAETIPVPIAVLRFLLHCFRCVLHVFFLPIICNSCWNLWRGLLFLPTPLVILVFCRKFTVNSTTCPLSNAVG